MGAVHGRRRPPASSTLPLPTPARVGGAPESRATQNGGAGNRWCRAPKSQRASSHRQGRYIILTSRGQLRAHASLIQNSFPSGSANIANAPHDSLCAGFVNRTPFASRALASAITSFARNPIPVFPFSRGFVSQRWISVSDPFAATVTQCPSLSRISKSSFSRHHVAAFFASETTTATSPNVSMAGATRGACINPALSGKIHPLRSGWRADAGTPVGRRKDDRARASRTRGNEPRRRRRVRVRGAWGGPGVLGPRPVRRPPAEAVVDPADVPRGGLRDALRAYPRGSAGRSDGVGPMAVREARRVVFDAAAVRPETVPLEGSHAGPAPDGRTVPRERAERPDLDVRGLREGSERGRG